jgi:hypothetical protein
MALIVGSFLSQSQAEQALLRLQEGGIGQDEAVLIANAATPQDGAAPDGQPASTPTETERVPSPAEPAAEGAVESPDEEPAAAASSEKEAEDAVNKAALGAAVGLFVGGGLMGPLGIALGSIVGTGMGLAAALVSRGLPSDEAERREADLLAGRYLVAVETDRKPAEEVQAMLEESGVAQVKVES